MKKIRTILEATSLADAVLVVLTPQDRLDVDAEAARETHGAAAFEEANGCPIITSRVDNSCVLHRDLTVHVLAFGTFRPWEPPNA
jgi:hypothetical protein